MTDWPFGNLRPFSYGKIIADPAWLYELYSKAGETKAPQAQYNCMSTDDIAALPVGHLAAGDCLLLLWATAPMLPDAFRVMSSWGFRYVTAGTWAKQSSTGKAWAFGTGYVLRSAAEFYLIGAIGSPEYVSRSERNLMVAPTRGHSRKPDDQYGLMDRLCPNVKGVELFARQTRPGWDAWGNEVGKFDGVEHNGRIEA
jgi:N6-adenosine-specific RNA methylase IME4